MHVEISVKALPLIVKIRNDSPKIHDFAYYLEYLVLHLPENMLVPALEWLVKNKLTGDKFLEFIVNDCHRSGLEFIRHITMRLEKEKQLRALTVRDIQ